MVPYQTLYSAHRFVCMDSRDGVIPLAAAFIDVASDWPRRRLWIGRAVTSDCKGDLIDPGEQIAIWLLPRARAGGVFVRVRVSILGGWEWSPLDVDTMSDRVVMQWARGEAFELEVDRLTVADVPECVLRCVE